MSVEPSALTQRIASIISRVALLKMDITAIQTELRALHASAIRMDKQTHKQCVKRACNKHATLGDNPHPTRGFARPSLLSSDMYEFLQITPGTLVPRTEVTCALSKYIKAHNLYRKPEGGRKKQIYPDESLTALLNIPTSDADIPLTYWSMQKYLNSHFIRGEPS